ncbi:hypothetical protein Tco_0822452 [Tanacetum coccineum]|uniref:Reverse transcriptase domain-containing protein n=1 Tax=Tanacetum coccineum TaxID=301880 RepID=A0ABQ5AG45_9ASTR
MSTHSGPSPTAPTSVVRNTVGREKEMPQGNLNGPASDAALREYYDKHYNQLLPILAEKVHQEKVHQEKLKAVKARLNSEEISQHFESGTPSRRRDLKKRLRSRRIRSMSGRPEPRRGRSKSPRKKDHKGKRCLKDWRRVRRDIESGYQSSHSRGTELAPEKHHNKRASSRRTEALSESKGSAGGHWKSWSKSKDQALRMTIYPSHRGISGKFLLAKKCTKDPMEIHHIKQSEGKSTKDFVRIFKVESRDVKGASKVMRISGFMHGITNPELIKRLHDEILKSIDEMMTITTSFLRTEGGIWQPTAEEVTSVMETAGGQT